MTVASPEGVFSYQGNGSTTEFVFDNQVYDRDGFLVAIRNTDTGIITPQVLDTDYTVTLNATNANASFITPPASNEIVTLERNEPCTQLIDYSEGGKFPYESHEIGLDRSVFRDQTIKARLARFTQSALGDEPAGPIPARPIRDGKLAGWSLDGTWTHYNFADVGTIITPLEEAVTLADGQTTVTFSSVTTGATAYHISGLLADQKRLTNGSDYTVTNISTIELTESYPAGTKIIAVQNDANAAPTPPVSLNTSRNFNTQTLSNGQTIVNFPTIDVGKSDFRLSGNLVDRGLLVDGEDYTVTGVNQITLTESYPAGTKLTGLQTIVEVA
jgi:hypothetical protein